MIINFEQTTDFPKHGYDICIIGSGAACLAMLTELFESDIKVLVLEAGGEMITDQNQQSYQTYNLAHPLPGTMDGRFKVFGGSTTKWGAQSLPLEEIDFEKRDWVPESGWPIKYSDVCRYNKNVDNFLGLNTEDYNSDIFKLLRKPPLETDQNINLKFSKWGPKPNIREKYRSNIEKATNITLLQNATVTSINLNEDFTTVSDLTVMNKSSLTVKISAKKIVLACGGIENPRLLLASNKQKQAGVGNNEGLVGRFLQEHPNAHVATLHPTNHNAQHYFNYFYLKGTRFLPKFIFSKHFQEQHQTLNSSAYFSFIVEDGEAFSLAKEIYRKYSRGNLGKNDFRLFLKLLKGTPDLIKIAFNYLAGGRVYTPNAKLKLNLMTEAKPNFNNRVSLSDSYDAFGVPKPLIYFEEDELLQRTFQKCTAFLQKYFDKINLGTLVTDNWMYQHNWFDNITDAKHHIGTTRMAETPLQGVVDSNCKVFGINNLYVAGSSVFPTSGHSNPTTTIIALSFRLIDHIKKTFND